MFYRYTYLLLFTFICVSTSHVLAQDIGTEVIPLEDEIASEDALELNDDVFADGIEPYVPDEEPLEEEEEEENEGLPPAEPVKNNNAEFKKLSLDEQLVMRVKMKEPGVLPSAIQSSFLTYDELDLLRQARAGLITALPTDEELDSGEVDEDTGEVIVRPESRRFIRLGGIVYVSAEDWSLWLNGREVRPNAIPSKVLDLKVYREYIELEWFDPQTNQIFPIRLRPNQTFNLDARLFLPG
ncbi:MAG: hypothetical protein HRT94_02410 [Alphaproteobacteria bacterium]|nr:hypothetical protein [Alphaproteobacteria bacterium]